MAVEILNFENSFIQFCQTEPGSCAEYNASVLPLKYYGDLSFSFALSAADLTEATNVFCAISTQSFTVGQTIDTGADYIINAAMTQATGAYGSDFLKIFSDDECLELDLADNGAVPGVCIYLVLYDDATKQVICTSNQIFNYVNDVCFTEVIRYRCNDDSFDFPYTSLDTLFGDEYWNRIRLKLDITSPKPLTKKTGFRKSDGSYVTLSAMKEKQWDVETDYYTDHLHQSIDAAIDHDFLYLVQSPPAECDYTDFQFYHPEDDKYDIDWNEGPANHHGVAKAKFKLKTNPYYSQNSNC